jgi:hypothetical protein
MGSIYPHYGRRPARWMRTKASRCGRTRSLSIGARGSSLVGAWGPTHWISSEVLPSLGQLGTGGRRRRKYPRFRKRMACTSSGRIARRERGPRTQPAAPVASEWGPESWLHLACPTVWRASVGLVSSSMGNVRCRWRSFGPTCRHRAEELARLSPLHAAFRVTRARRNTRAGAR